MKTIVILGRQPELGLVELESKFGAEAVMPWGKSAALLQESPDISSLGGTIKSGRIIYRGPEHDINEAPLSLDDLPRRDGKTTFGMSFYGLNASTKYVMSAGLTLKKRLKQRGSVRFVSPQTGTSLGAAQVKFNGLVRDGFELLVASHNGEMVVALTEAVQDIDWYAARDYGRPTRSAKVGMLPPKLAQIMINTSGDAPVYDPFCGTRVVLQEAVLMGRPAGGSDISPDMVRATTENMQWLQKLQPDIPPWYAIEHDAATVTLPRQPIAIVTEGYLGPNQTKRPDAQATRQLKAELLPIFTESLKNWSSQLDTGSCVTITTPLWQTRTGWEGLEIIDQLPDLGYTLKRFQHVRSNNLAYRRPNQYVGRQLLILRKQ